MKYKLIAFDLDGTVLDDAKNIDPRTIAALDAAAEEGVIIVPSSGRVFDAMPAPIRELPYVRYAITANGAGVYDRQENRYLYEAYLTPEYVFGIFDYLEQFDCVLEAFQDFTPYIAGKDLDRLLSFYDNNPGIRKLMLETRIPVENVRDTLSAAGTPVQKAQVHFATKELKSQMLPEIQKHFPEIVATSSLPLNIEMNAARATKGAGLSALCRALGIDPKDTIAFGDGSNDITMLQAAGMGFAMKNAPDDVKAAADRVTEFDNNNGGVYATIVELLEKC